MFHAFGRSRLCCSPKLEDFERGVQCIPLLPGNDFPGCGKLTGQSDQGERTGDPLFLRRKIISETRQQRGQGGPWGIPAGPASINR